MRYAIPPVRPGFTAIAAVLALSSTPLFAQDAAPVAVTPPAVEITAPTTAPDAPTITTVAPEAPVAVQSAPVATTTSPSSGSLVTVPIRPGGIAPGFDAAPSTSTAAPAIESPTEPAPAARTTPVERTAPTTTARSTHTTAAPAVERAAPEPEAVTPPPAPVVVPTPPVAERTAPATAPVVPTAQANGGDDILPIAGAAGAAILLIGGSLFVMGRRRRDGRAYVADTVVTPVEANPPVAHRPVMAAPLATPAPATPMAHTGAADAPSTAIPAGFDTSRFGRHTRAAYEGPTPDNPFLSLRRRLKRASFMDQRERMAAEGTRPVMQEASVPAPQPAPAPRHTEHVTTRIKAPPRPAFRPAWQG